MLEVSWTKQSCLIEKKTNINKFDNQNCVINEKLSTFDAPEHIVNQSIFMRKFCFNFTNEKDSNSM